MVSETMAQYFPLDEQIPPILPPPTPPPTPLGFDSKFAVYMTAPQVLPNPLVGYNIHFDTKNYDTLNEITLGANPFFTATAAGWYIMTCLITWDTLTANDRIDLGFNILDIFQRRQATKQWLGGAWKPSQQLTVMCHLNAGDTVNFWAAWFGGGNNRQLAGTATYTWWTGYRFC